MELTTAVLSILFFHHSSLLVGKKHKCNSKITPVKLPRNFNASPNLSMDMLEINVSIEDAEDLGDTMKTTALKFLSRIAATLRVVKYMWTISTHRSFKPGNMLNFKIYDYQLIENQPSSHSKMSEDVLRYNLNVFQLGLLPSANDGDSCFSSILKMFYQQITEDTELMGHFTTLGFTQDIEKDVLTLR